MTITLHYLSRSRAARVVWMLEELGLDYDVKTYLRDPATYFAPPELAKVHPSGTSPLLEDDGAVYAESGFILEHLVEKYGKDTDLIWKNDEERRNIKYALYAAESNIMIQSFLLYIHRAAVQKAPWGISRILKLALDQIDNAYAGKKFQGTLQQLNDHIEANGGYYCAGRFTVADVMYWISLEVFINAGIGITLENFPALKKWSDALKSREKYKLAKQKERTWESQASSRL